MTGMKKIDFYRSGHTITASPFRGMPVNTAVIIMFASLDNAWRWRGEVAYR